MTVIALWLITTILLFIESARAGEAPSLAAEVKAGKLPPLVERLPKNPAVTNVKAIGREIGQYGGEVRMLIGGQKDIRYMTMFGYARLVTLNEKLEYQPDILESFDIQEGRVFTFKLRDGLKWSDGHPVTSEDFRYTFEDVIMNDDISPGRAPELLVGGEPPAFEVIDPLTVRYTWKAPNPDFMPKLAAAQWLSLLMPAHYLKQFHKKYQDEAKLEELIEKNKAKKWTRLHTNKMRQYRPENPDLPSLDPWINTVKPPAEQFVFERNPYFYRVDEAGNQLPYIGRWVLNVVSSSLIPAKTAAGDSDLQGMPLEFEDYTFLKNAERLQPIKVKLWKRGTGSRLALLPNLNFIDDGWRPILQDARFRQALSLAIDRAEINSAVFYGLGTGSADTVLPASPLYREAYAKAFAKHDAARANALLDELGLDKRNSDGVRLLPDGRPAEIVLEYAGESQVETDVLELVTDYWDRVGIKLFVRATQRDILRSRILGGQTMMSVWTGLENAIPTADMSPANLAPTREDQLQWPMWGMHYESSGERGEEPTEPVAQQLVALLREWKATASAARREAIWHQMLTLYAENVFSIGLVNQTLQPIVVNARLKNMPDEGLWAFDPSCFLGMYRPDTFWFAPESATQ
jgi:peptide/nickel transport system substrate-binding protein